MALDRSQVEHIAALARIGLTDADIDMFAEQLSHILEQFEVLSELDTEDIEPTSNAGDLQTVMRDDQPEDSLDRSEVLSNAPRHDAEFIRVKAVLEE